MQIWLDSRANLHHQQPHHLSQGISFKYFKLERTTNGLTQSLKGGEEKARTLLNKIYTNPIRDYYEDQ